MKNQGTPKKIDIFDFEDYKAFIDEALDRSPVGGRGAYKRLADALRIHPSRLSQILRGEEDLTVEHALEVAKFIQLDSVGTDFLITLVEKSRAGTQELKGYWQRKIETLKETQTLVASHITDSQILSDVAAATYYSSWHYQAARLLCDINKFQTREAIAEKLKLTLEQTDSILKFLVEEELCTKEGKRYKRTSFHTHLEKSSPFVIGHHKNWRLFHLNNADNHWKKDLHFTCPLTSNEEDAKKIHGLLLKVIAEIDEIITDSPSEDLYSLNIDFGSI